MKINLTLVNFNGEKGSMLSIVLIKARNGSIPTMKIRQMEYYTGFFKLNSVENKMQLESESSSHK